MKIIHTADLHLGSRLLTHFSRSNAELRKAELLSNVRRLCESARHSGVSAIIIAGDLFDTERVARSTKEAFLSTVEAFSEITFLYLNGNHEGDALSSMENLPDNLKVFGDEWTRYDIEDVTFIGRNNLGYGLFNNLPIEKDRYNIAVLHGEIAERSAENTIGKRDMAGSDLNYIALGHYHGFELCEIDRRVSYAYSGTLEGRGFDECGEKGYVLIDTMRNTKTFVPFAKRTVREIEVDLTGKRRQFECESALEDALSIAKERDIVRVVITGTYSTDFKYNKDALLSAFAYRYFYFEIKDKSRLEINMDELRYDKSLKGELIRTVMARDDIGEEKKSKIISCAIAALNDEDYGG